MSALVGANLLTFIVALLGRKQQFFLGSEITFLICSLFDAFSFLRLVCLFLLFVIGYSYEEMSVEVLRLVGDWLV